MLLGTDGYTLFDPETETFIHTELSIELGHPRGAATAFLPGEQRIWSSGGHDGGCFSHHMLTLDPRLPIETGIGITYLGQIPSPINSQNDGTAVYIPTLDRVLFFGGFQDSVLGCAPDIWPNPPAVGDYHSGIYSVSPEYQGGWGESGFVVKTILNPTISQPTTITVEKSVTPGDGSEQFVVAIQAAFLNEDQVAQPKIRTVTVDTMYFNGGNTEKTIQISIPENIAPSPTNSNGQQVVAICVFSLGTSSTSQTIPNCREVAVTLNPGSLHGTIYDDQIGETGGAHVELLDVDGDLIGYQVTGSNGSYDFCSGGNNCLAIGTYTLNVTRPSDPTDLYLRLPQAVQIDIQAGTSKTVDVTLETTPVLGPQINRMTAEHNALYGDTVGTFLAFDHLRGQAGVPAIPVVDNKFTLDVVRFAPTINNPLSEISSVAVAINGHQSAAADIGNGQWQVEFDMSLVLTAGSNKMTVTAADSRTPPLISTREYAVMAVPAKPATNGQGSLPASYVNLQEINWYPISERYETRILVPAGLRWPTNPPHILDLELIKLYSQLRADIEIFEEFHIGGKRVAEGDGAILVQILATAPGDFDLEERFVVTPIMNDAGTDIESYLVESDEYDLCQLGLPKCGEWIPIKYFEDEVSYEAGPAEFSANFAVGISAQYAATLRLEGTLRGDDYTLKKIRVIPQPELALQAKGEAEVSASIDLWLTNPSITIGGGVEVNGRLYYAQPIAYEPALPTPVYLDNPCVRFVATAHAWASMPDPFPNFDTGDFEIVNVEEGPGCNSQAIQFAAATALPEPPELLPVPIVVMSADRRHTMQLWVENGMNGSTEVSKLGYKITTDGSSTSGNIPSTATVINPAAAFTGDSSAIVVWSQLDPAQANPATATINEIMATQEIYTAVWTEASGWETPVRLTNNSASDGLPVIAADPNTGKAIVAWMRDNDANPETKLDLTVVTRHWNGTNWGAEQVVGSDPTSADTQPAIAYTTDGSAAWIIWTREHDADFNTNADRRLNYAIWNGSQWSAAAEPNNWPAGALNPQLVFSSTSDKPLVTMIVRGNLGQDFEGNDLGEAVGGKEGHLYAAWYGSAASGWDVQSIHDTRAETAQPILASPNRALIVMRNFGGGSSDGYPSAGRIAVAAGEINPDGSRWVEPGLITTGNLPVWQVQGISVPLSDPSDADFGLEFIAVQQDQTVTQNQASTLVPYAPATIETVDHVQANNLAGTNQTSIFDFDPATDGVDIELESVQFSNLVPAPGEIVTITATVRSLTVRPMSWAGSTAVRMEVRGWRDKFNENIQLVSELYDQDMLFNERRTFIMTYRSTGEPGIITVNAHYLGGDLDTSNNKLYLEIGIIPEPKMFLVNELETTTTLTWTPPLDGTDINWLYRVYRGPTADGPWAFYGITRELGFVDTNPADGMSFYAVQAYDQLGNESTKVSNSNPEKPEIPSTTYEIYLPTVTR